MDGEALDVAGGQVAGRALCAAMEVASRRRGRREAIPWAEHIAFFLGCSLAVIRYMLIMYVYTYDNTFSIFLYTHESVRVIICNIM